MSLCVPSPQDLPFISASFRRALRVAGDSLEPNGGVHRPGELLEYFSDGFGQLDEHIASGLLAVLRPEFKGTAILSKSSLEASAIAFRDEYLATPEVANGAPKPTHDQCQMWLLQTAPYAKHIDWRKAVKLLNECSEDQRSKAEAFFCELCGSSINSLISTDVSRIAIPDGLIQAETRENDGETEMFCPLAKEWLRDDIFLTQFLVRTDIRTQHSIVSSDLGYAGTLEQAFAIATAFTLSCGRSDDSENSYINRIREFAENSKACIVKIFLQDDYLQDELVSSARLEKYVRKEPDGKQSLAFKLEWDYADRRTVPEQTLKKALFSTEKLLGVQWSKIRHLENDLGM